MAHILSVSLDEYYHNMMKKMALSPSKAIRVGIRAMMNEELEDESVEIEETVRTKLYKLQRINNILTEELHKTQNVLDKERKASGKTSGVD